MPILVHDGGRRASTTSSRFSLDVNPHDLATSLWTRDDAKLSRGAPRSLGGMLKENDGTDSALEWEEFGASGVGESGNTGVGDADDDDRDVLPAAKGPALRPSQPHDLNRFDASLPREGSFPRPRDACLPL